MRMIDETFCKVVLPDSTQMSIITLIFKKLDKALLKNKDQLVKLIAIIKS